LDALREEWLDSTDIGVQKQTSERMQLQLWQDVPYIPLGHWVRSTAHRRNIVDVPWGFAAFLRGAESLILLGISGGMQCDAVTCLS